MTQRAEVSRQTWYRYWRADDSAYLDELLQTALDTLSILLAPRLRAVALGPGDPEQLVVELAAAHFALVAQRRVAIPHLVGVVLALEDRYLEAEDGTRPTSAPAIVREYQEHVHRALLDAYGAVLDQWGRRPRPGTDLDRITEIVGALADGFALRHIVDPDGASAATFARAAVELVRSLTDAAAGVGPDERCA